jgi:hypothetical protein
LQRAFAYATLNLTAIQAMIILTLSIVLASPLSSPAAAAAARQKQLADMFKGNGSVLFADVPHNTIVLFNNMRCNLTYEVRIWAAAPLLG